MIIAISGSPCTGKTEVAKALTKKLGWRLVQLNELAKRKRFFSGFDRKREVPIVNLQRLQDEIKQIQKKERNIVIESHYAHDLKNNLTVILRTDIKELRKRMGKRKWPSKKIDENILSEIMEVCKTEALQKKRKILEIDTTRKKPEMIADEIIQFLEVKISK